MSIIFFIYMLTLLFLLFLTALFLFLLLRKLVLLRQESRDKRYEAYIFPKLSQFVTQEKEDNQNLRLFRYAKPWQRQILLRQLLDIAVNVGDAAELHRIGVVCSLLRLEERLGRQLLDKRWWKQAEGLRHIGLLKLQSFFPQVESHLHSEHYDVWTAAARTLTQLGRNDRLIQFLIDRHEKLKREAVIRLADMLRSLSDSEVDLMLAHIDRIPLLLKGLFIDLFGQVRAMKALPVLESYLTSETGELRVKAMKAIADIGITSRQDEVLRGLQNGNWVERMQTIRIVRASSMYAAIPLLTESLADPEWWVRFHAAETLAGFGSLGKKQLHEAALHHHDSYARDIAKQTLRKWNS